MSIVVPHVYVVVGADSVVRGFPFVQSSMAKEATKEADSHWPSAAPHVVVRFVPTEVVK